MTLICLDEVAGRLGVSNLKARKLVLYDEVMPHKQVGPRGIRVLEDDLESYIKSPESIKEERNAKRG